MSLALQRRVSDLEAEVVALRQAIDGLITAMSDLNDPLPQELKANPNGPRKMCPKCGVKPNYHLHVVNCKGPWQGAPRGGNGAI